MLDKHCSADTFFSLQTNRAFDFNYSTRVMVFICAVKSGDWRFDAVVIAVQCS